MIPWPHQLRAVDEALAAISGGQRRLCVTSPTGGGKTFIMQHFAKRYLDQSQKVVLYANRRMLIDQTSDVLMNAGIYHGVRAAGYEDEREHNFQVSSIQTEHSRVNRKKTWALHDAKLVLVDEAHVQTGAVVQKILQAHYEAGAVIVGFTATPIGVSGLYDHLIVGRDNERITGLRSISLGHSLCPGRAGHESLQEAPRRRGPLREPTVQGHDGARHFWPRLGQL